jgi:hypothetical protein
MDKKLNYGCIDVDYLILVADLNVRRLKNSCVTFWRSALTFASGYPSMFYLIGNEFIYNLERFSVGGPIRGPGGPTRQIILFDDYGLRVFDDFKSLV